ncbi:MAG: hypothetical protein OHK0039_43580 [Bacteroidia bacterium]
MIAIYLLLVLGGYGGHLLSQDLPQTPDMRMVSGGRFFMGNDTGNSDELPVHAVTVDSFLLSTCEIRVWDFAAFVRATGYQTDAEQEGWSWVWDGREWVQMQGVCWRHDATGQLRPSREDSHPVVHVSWQDARAYCVWLSLMQGLDPDGPQAYRLPSEAEWEYAAGNGSRHTLYSWGHGPPTRGRGGNLADEKGSRVNAWSRTTDNMWLGYYDGHAYTAPVGRLDVNDFGLCDMTGNVWEWCADWYHPSYAGAPADGSAWLDPPGSGRVFRGGYWGARPAQCRTSFRVSADPRNRAGMTGFRIARSP